MLLGHQINYHRKSSEDPQHLPNISELFSQDLHHKLTMMTSRALTTNHWILLLLTTPVCMPCTGETVAPSVKIGDQDYTVVNSTKRRNTLFYAIPHNYMLIIICSPLQLQSVECNFRISRFPYVNTRSMEPRCNIF